MLIPHSYILGRASDLFGRKAVIITGLCITMTICLTVGLSDSLAAALVNRAFAGLGGGIVPQRELQPRAFGIVPLTFTIGSMMRPAFGGFLANAAIKYPTVLGDSQFLQKYPYALLNLATGGLFAVTISVCTLFFRETLISKRNGPDLGLKLCRAITNGFGCRKQHRVSSNDRPNLEATPLIQETFTRLQSSDSSLSNDYQ